jgi:hypothetical protein
MRILIIEDDNETAAYLGSSGKPARPEHGRMARRRGDGR